MKKKLASIFLGLMCNTAFSEPEFYLNQKCDNLPVSPEWAFIRSPEQLGSIQATSWVKTCLNGSDLCYDWREEEGIPGLKQYHHGTTYNYYTNVDDTGIFGKTVRLSKVNGDYKIKTDEGLFSISFTIGGNHIQALPMPYRIVNKSSHLEYTKTGNISVYGGESCFLIVAEDKYEQGHETVHRVTNWISRYSE